MQRAPKNRTLWWAYALFLTLVGFVAKILGSKLNYTLYKLVNEGRSLEIQFRKGDTRNGR
jgi:hypothetical protein